MLIDDRLATVLRQRAGGETTARIQFRQLLDLLGTMPSEANGPQVNAAHDRLAELSAAIPARGRAAILAEPGVRLRNARLVANLCGGEPEVARAALEAADLAEEQWLDLAPALPVTARGAIRRRRSLGPKVEALLDRLGIHDRALPPVEQAREHRAFEHVATEPVSSGRMAPEQGAKVVPIRDPVPGPASGDQGIGAIVRRIEDFRRSRLPIEAEPLHSDSPFLPLDDMAEHRMGPPVQAFDFATDVEGRITWSDQNVAPMVVGMRLAGAESISRGSSGTIALAMRNRQPVRGARFVIEGAAAVAGPWRLDAAPEFDTAGGRFTGYTGRMRRLDSGEGAAQATREASESDRIRQLLHELRTPINAIQGFAEVIQQQLFGPTPHEYRALAASIAADAAHMLAGFDELERLAKLEAQALELEEGSCDLAEVVRRTVDQLRHFTKARDSGFVLDLPEGALPVGLAQADAEKLVWRLLAALAGAAHPGESTRIAASWSGTAIELALQLPVSLAAKDDAELMRATAGQSGPALSASTFGAGFALRLARAEARATGGSLERRGQDMVLRLTGLTGGEAGHSQMEVAG